MPADENRGPAPPGRVARAASRSGTPPSCRLLSIRTWRGSLLLRHQRAVHLGPAVPDAVDLVLAGDLHDALAPRRLRVDLRRQDRLALAGLGQQLAVGVDDPALADEQKAAL